MKLIVKLLMVTFLISSVGLVYAQAPVDKSNKNKDEIVKDKSKGDSKTTKGSSAGRLSDVDALPGVADAPTKDAGNDEAVKSKSSFFGKLFGGKSAPEGHSSKTAASSRGGSAKTKKGSSKGSSKGTSRGATLDSGEEGGEKGKDGGR